MKVRVAKVNHLPGFAGSEAGFPLRLEDSILEEIVTKEAVRLVGF